MLTGFLRACGAAVLASLLVAGLTACMSTPEYAKTSFMTDAEGVRAPVNDPIGLNPLGLLETCTLNGPAVPLGERVLVSRPEQFTREASVMLSTLRRGLVESEPPDHTITFLIAAKPIESTAVAQAEGRRCGALVVLWEPFGTRTLELTLPNPAQIPLRTSVYSRLCEFGNYEEQYDILFLTINGLLSMLNNQYDQAVTYLGQAKRIDSHCLQLPGVTP